MFWSFKKKSKNKITSLKWVTFTATWEFNLTDSKMTSLKGIPFTASWEFNIPKDDIDNLTSQKQGKTVFVSSSDWKIINSDFDSVLPFQGNEKVAFKKKDWTVWQILEDWTILSEGQNRYSV